MSLLFRRWAEDEIGYLDRVIEAFGDPMYRMRAERSMLRRAVAWIESAADVPYDERLTAGGVRRERAYRWQTADAAAGARIEAHEDDTAEALA